MALFERYKMSVFNHFRKRILVSGLACLALTLASAARADTNDCSSVKLNGSSVWYPISMRQEADVGLNGVFPDLAIEIFSALDLPLVMGPDLPWKRLLTLLEHGQIDVLAGAYLTDERLAKFGVSLPVMREDVGVFVRTSLDIRPASLEDLAGLRGVAPFGASFGEEFETYAAAKLSIDRQPFDDFKTNMYLLAEDKADYLVIARRDGEMMIQEAGVEGKVEVLPWSAAVNTVHFLFSRATPCIRMLESFDEELQRRRESGELNKLIEGYTLPTGDG
nr:transporter substrate-binding domain-containing protein [Pseudomonadota bacterium]